MATVRDAGIGQVTTLFAAVSQMTGLFRALLERTSLSINTSLWDLDATVT